MVVDLLVFVEIVKVGMDLYFKNCGNKFVVVIIYIYSYVDYYGGVCGVVDEVDVKFGKVKVYVFVGFMEVVVVENIMVGNVMSCCVSYMYGNFLKLDVFGQVGVGLGMIIFVGMVILIVFINIIDKDGQKEVIDGLIYDFMLVSGLEVFLEMLWFIEEKKFIEVVEDVIYILYNIYLLCGVKICELLLWLKYINEVIVCWGDKVEIIMVQYYWLIWGNENVVGLLKSQ